MTLKEAFAYQIENTRLLIEDDLKDDDSYAPVVWNGVIFRPIGNFYSSGKTMSVGDKLLICYIVKEDETPTAFLIEESELDGYESKLQVIRIADNVPVLTACLGPTPLSPC